MSSNPSRHKIVEYASAEMKNQFEEAQRLDNAHAEAIRTSERRAREADERRSKELTNVLIFAAAIVFLLFAYIMIFLKPRSKM